MRVKRPTKNQIAAEIARLKKPKIARQIAAEIARLKKPKIARQIAAEIARLKKPKIARQIAAEIARLKKPKIARRNGFGDDNHAAIDVEVEVLMNNLDDDTIYHRYGNQDDGGFKETILSSALDARRLLDGDGDGKAPSESWKTAKND